MGLGSDAALVSLYRTVHLVYPDYGGGGHEGWWRALQVFSRWKK